LFQLDSAKIAIFTFLKWNELNVTYLHQMEQEKRRRKKVGKKLEDYWMNITSISYIFKYSKKRRRMELVRNDA